MWDLLTKIGHVATTSLQLQHLPHHRGGYPIQPDAAHQRLSHHVTRTKFRIKGVGRQTVRSVLRSNPVASSTGGPIYQLLERDASFRHHATQAGLEQRGWVNHVANREDADPTEGREFENVLSAGLQKQIPIQSRQKNAHMSDRCVPQMKVQVCRLGPKKQACRHLSLTTSKQMINVPFPRQIFTQGNPN